MTQVCVFYDEVDDDGWARTRGIHHQPHKLTEEARAKGVMVDAPGKAPVAKAGKSAAFYVHPESGAAEWRVVLDPDFKMPAADFLALLPAQARVMARMARDTDPVIDDLMSMLEMLVADNASTGIHPMGRGAREGIGYLVSKGMMTQEQADEILD
jgi:hypothetical protein